MRVQIKLMTDEKTVVLNISDTEAVAAVADVDPDAKALMADLHHFLDGVLASNADAGVVDLTPENAIEVFSGKKKGVSEPEPEPDLADAS